MHKYAVLLRAVNVGGTSIIKMNDLLVLFESFGFKDVSTYIQSGNVIFSSEESDAGRLKELIEKKLEQSLGYKVTVFVLTPDYLKKTAEENPFDPEEMDKRMCHIMFLSDEPDSVHVEALMAMQGSEYIFHVSGRILYYSYPAEIAGARRNINFEKVLGVCGTSRSWKVVARLIELTAPE